jgi:hypothetical protein
MGIEHGLTTLIDHVPTMPSELLFKSHPSEDLLEEYAFGRLSEEQLAIWENTC